MRREKRTRSYSRWDWPRFDFETDSRVDHTTTTMTCSGCHFWFRVFFEMWDRSKYQVVSFFSLKSQKLLASVINEEKMEMCTVRWLICCVHKFYTPRTQRDECIAVCWFYWNYSIIIKDTKYDHNLSKYMPLRSPPSEWTFHNDSPSHYSHGCTRS